VGVDFPGLLRVSLWPWVLPRLLLLLLLLLLIPLRVQPVLWLLLVAKRKWLLALLLGCQLLCW
jgi:hypothetical protein